MQPSVTNPTLQDVLAQALRLTAHQRLELIAQLAESVRIEPTSEAEHWGKSLNALASTLDLSEWEKIGDPAEWLRERRESALRHRLGLVPDEAQV